MSLFEMSQKIKLLEEENQALREKIAVLERRLGLNSQTSSKPPSSDGLKKKPRTRSLRKKSGRKSGGQKGNKGYTLEAVENPDKIVQHLAPESCEKCGSDLSSQQVIRVIKRQVFDVPPPQIEVTEHQVLVKKCPCCEAKRQGSFPPQVKAHTQYGERIKAISVYLKYQHFIPGARLSDLLWDLFSSQISKSRTINYHRRYQNKIKTFI